MIILYHRLNILKFRFNFIYFLPINNNDNSRINEQIIYKKLDYYNDLTIIMITQLLLIELKSRRCSFNEYNDAMINVS